MKNPSFSIFLLMVCATLVATPAFSQGHCNLLQVNNSAQAIHAFNVGYWFGIMELPFLFIAVFFAFLTANNMKGGRFGRRITFF
ncbi:MAG TPA: hypothetical protein VIH61_01365 [Waddliaceae bacterium]